MISDLFLLIDLLLEQNGAKATTLRAHHARNVTTFILCTWPSFMATSHCFYVRPLRTTSTCGHCALFYVRPHALSTHLAITLQRNLNLCVPRKGILRPQSQFPHSCVCERSNNFPTFGPPIFLQHNSRQTDQRNISIAHRNMNAAVGTVAAQFLSWEYLFQIFGFLSLQCLWGTTYIYALFHADSAALLNLLENNLGRSKPATRLMQAQ
jgi:hypothetical protein